MSGPTGIAPFWDTTLAPEVPWRQCYPVVEKHAREYLIHIPKDDYMTTAALVEAMYPYEDAAGRTASLQARRRLFSALDALAKHGLSDCFHLAARQKLKLGNYGRPKLWHNPGKQPAKAPNVCPHCGKEIT